MRIIQGVNGFTNKVEPNKTIRFDCTSNNATNDKGVLRIKYVAKMAKFSKYDGSSSLSRFKTFPIFKFDIEGHTSLSMVLVSGLRFYMPLSGKLINETKDNVVQALPLFFRRAQSFVPIQFRGEKDYVIISIDIDNILANEKSLSSALFITPGEIELFKMFVKSAILTNAMIRRSVTDIQKKDKLLTLRVLLNDRGIAYDVPAKML